MGNHIGESNAEMAIRTQKKIDSMLGSKLYQCGLEFDVHDATKLLFGENDTTNPSNSILANMVKRGLLRSFIIHRSSGGTKKMFIKSQEVKLNWISTSGEQMAAVYQPRWY